MNNDAIQAYKTAWDAMDTTRLSRQQAQQIFEQSRTVDWVRDGKGTLCSGSQPLSESPNATEGHILLQDLYSIIGEGKADQIEDVHKKSAAARMTLEGEYEALSQQIRQGKQHALERELRQQQAMVDGKLRGINHFPDIVNRSLGVEKLFTSSGGWLGGDIPEVTFDVKKMREIAHDIAPAEKAAARGK